MSLRVFHIVFVCICLVFTLGFGAWCFWTFFENRDWFYVATGIVSVAACPALMVYGRYFLRKVRRLDDA